MKVRYFFYLSFFILFISILVPESESALLENTITIDNSVEIHSILHGKNGYIYSSSTVPGPFEEEGIVSVINSTTNTVIDTIRVGKSPTELDINPNNNLLYVANSGNNTVTIINTTDNSILKSWITYTNVIDIIVNPQIIMFIHLLLMI